MLACGNWDLGLISNNGQLYLCRCLIAIGDTGEWPVRQSLVTKSDCEGAGMWRLIEEYKAQYGFKRVNLHCCQENMCNDAWPEDVKSEWQRGCVIPGDFFAPAFFCILHSRLSMMT